MMDHSSKSRVDFYAVGLSETPVYFQNGEVCCFRCKYRRSKTTNGHLRIICTQTYESLNEIDIYAQRGYDCQLKIQEEVIGAKDIKKEE